VHTPTRFIETRRRRLVPFALVAVATLAAACSGSSSENGDAERGASVATAGCQAPGDCPLRVLADERDVLVGTAVRWDLLDDPIYADTIAREFNSVTPERELKWNVLQPERGVWDFEPADRIVEFAQENGIAVKGHTLVWAQQSVDSTPDWVEQINDPDELRAVLEEHITTVMEHYRGQVDRWDVVNEAFQTAGEGLYDNHFHRVLGPGYLADAFAMAHEADPDVRLFLNENVVEYFPTKRAALVDFVTGLLEDGVPIHGVGLQLHLLAGPPEVDVVANLCETFTAMGLEVAITELDVPLREGDNLQSQAQTYRQVIDECLAAGSRDVTFWGFTDAVTWIDDFMEPGLQPLLLDQQYERKPSYDAVWSTLAG